MEVNVDVGEWVFSGRVNEGRKHKGNEMTEVRDE